MAKVKAVVRGPEDYFNGAVLNPPGSVVEVDEDLVSEDDFYEVTVEVKLKDPVIDKDGVVHRFVKEKIRKRVMFRPLDGVVRAIDAAPAASGVKPDRLNVADFLKGGVSDIADKIATGDLDDFLDVIANAESQHKARKGVFDAIAERMSKA